MTRSHRDLIRIRYVSASTRWRRVHAKSCTPGVDGGIKEEEGMERWRKVAFLIRLC